ncbi:glycerophosphodiester phosphodiesterase [Alicycliphilus denitrificans]|uniref:glycerophosphodiester phosphodiesterase n=1 Tax=Alicycliphilus denitrificans TaxID=179636 RepID=UPI003850783D
MSAPLSPWPYPRWIAHRGAGRLAPENTLAAFRLGARHGYRMFECDVKLSSDGVLVLLHDATLERTTSGHGLAGAQPWRELAQLDAGGWHSRQYAGEPLPTLTNVARWCIANGYHLNIEIKPTPGTEPETGRAVAQLAAQLWQGQAAAPLLTSFKAAALAAAREAAPQLPRGLLVDKLAEGDADMQTALQLACQAMVLNHGLWDAALVAQVHGRGMRCLSYTVNDAWAAERLIALRTDGIITDRVDLFSPAAG